MAAQGPSKTPLESWHQNHGGRIVEFGGWLMPLQYTSILREHDAVRQRVGLFDISHMGRLHLRGPGALEWVDHVTTNDPARLKLGQVQYSLMLEDDGGIRDDLLVSKDLDGFAIVCNASNRNAVKERLTSRQPDSAQDCTLVDLTETTAMIALQGPYSWQSLHSLCSQEVGSLRYYYFLKGEVAGAPAVISRTGYTGEDGFEITVDSSAALHVWESLLRAGAARGIQPCGLGARDTLRFEAAMPLYGHELSPRINPFQAGLGWAVRMDKAPFVGKDALERLRNQPERTRVGLRIASKKIARQGYDIINNGNVVGVVTSGSFSPTLQQSLAMAFVDLALSDVGTPLAVNLRGALEPAEVVSLPFYRRDRYLSKTLRETPSPETQA